MITETYKGWITGIFDRTASIYGQESSTFFDYFAEKLVAQANLPTSAQILDVATGRGAVLKAAAKVVGPLGSLVGMDISPSMIAETAKEWQGQAHVQLCCMDAECLEFADDTFDFVFCAFGIFFFPDIAKALNEMRRVCKPGGKLLLSIWGQDDLLDQIFNEEYKKLGYQVKALIHDFENKNHLLKILSESNFTNIRIIADQLDYVYPTCEDWFQSLWGHASRAKLEKCNPQQLQALKDRLYQRLSPFIQSDGLHEQLHVHYSISTKM